MIFLGLRSLLIVLTTKSSLRNPNDNGMHRRGACAAIPSGIPVDSAALAFLERCGSGPGCLGFGLLCRFRVVWLPLTRRMAGSSLDSCSFGAMLKVLVLSIRNVPFVFLTSKEPIHIRLGARDGELHRVLSGHRESCVGDATATARSTSRGGLTRCDWVWKHTTIFAVSCFRQFRVTSCQ